MRSVSGIKALVAGVRALETFARHAPIDRAGFARVSGLDAAAATALIAVYTQSGYIRSLPRSDLWVLTPLGLALAAGGNPAGTIVARAAEAIDQLGATLGQPVTLEIGRGPYMLCCLNSGGEGARGPQPGARREVLRCLSGLVQIACGGTQRLDRAADAVRRARHAHEDDGQGSVIAVPIGGAHRVDAVLSAHCAPLAGEPATALLPLLVREAARLAAPAGGGDVVPLDAPGRRARQVLSPELLH